MQRLLMIGLALLLSSAAYAVSSAPYDLESGCSQTVVDNAPAEGRATAENWGPDTVVFTVEENVDGTWKKKEEFDLEKGKEKDIELGKGDRIKVRTLIRDRGGKGAKGRVVVPWD